MATRLSTSALRRIGQAVRTVEAGRGKGARTISAAPAWTLRMAKVASVVDDTPDAGDPYTYLVDIYAGSWDDTPAVRTALAEDAELWSRTKLAVDDWVSVIRVGAHWEVFSGGGAFTRSAPVYPLILGQDSEGTSDAAITTPYDPAVPTTQTVATSTAHTASTDSVDGVSIWVCSRLRYDTAATTPVLYGYMSKLTFPASIAPVVSGQTRVTIDSPEVF